MSAGEIQPIQLLRALAALAVATVHLALAYADHVGAGLGVDRWHPLLNQLAQASVALFFMVSGYVMVLASARAFGQPGGSAWFWRRRAFRVLPPYWLASALMLGVLAWQGAVPAAADVARSAVLWPYWPATGAMPVPLLWVGWTLFYEGLFYLLFGLGVSRGRGVALGLASLGLLGLGAFGLLLRPDNAALFALTRPVLWLFIPGMALAAWHGRGGRVPAWLSALALVAVVPAALLAPVPAEPLGAAYLLWAGGPALLLFLAVAGRDWRVPCWRVVGPLGHASYALYLLHVPLGQGLTMLAPGRLFALGPWVFLALLIIATLIASLAFCRWIERPLTRWLNARFALEPGHRHAT